MECRYYGVESVAISSVLVRNDNNLNKLIRGKNISLKHLCKVYSFRGSKLLNNCISRFKMIRAENFNNIIVGTLNINSISPKFYEFKLIVSGYFDVIIVTETKLDGSFPKAQFCIDGFSIPYRLDRNRNGRGLMMYVRDYIPSKMLAKHNLPEDIEAAFIELNFRKCKRFICATYRAPSQNHNYLFNNIDK